MSQNVRLEAMAATENRSWGHTVLLFLGACSLVVFFGYGSIGLASERTGDVPFQIVVFPLVLLLSALILAVLGVIEQLTSKSALIVVGASAVVFLASALAHNRYGGVQHLRVAGLEVEIEREYEDPFDYFVARWRTPGASWSRRQHIGDELSHKPPFRLESVGDGTGMIRDGTGKMRVRIGPGVPEWTANSEGQKGEPGGAANGSQPIRSETNRTPSAAGSRRSP